MALKRKRLAIITHEYYPILCGGTVFVEKMAEELTQMGYEIDILTGGVGKGFARLEENGAVKVRRFWVGRKSRHDASMIEHLLFFALGLPQMFLYMLRRRFDLLFPVFAIPSGLIAVILSTIFGTPSVVFVDAADTPGVAAALTKVVRHLAPIFRFVTRLSTGVVVLEGLEDLAMPYIKNSHVTIIANGTSIPELQAKPGTNGANLQMLSIGRLVFRKGFAEIIEALALVKKVRDDFVLTIVGYGTGEAEVVAAIKQFSLEKNVVMTGRVEYAKLKEFYLNSDVYIFYGDREGSSLAMIEAVSYGLPVIASDHPGNRSYIRDKESGYLVPRDAAVLAETVLNLLKRKDELHEMGNAARDMALNYSWRKVAERYHDFFEKVVAEKNAKTSSLPVT